jgi:hypothetical protein
MFRAVTLQAHCLFCFPSCANEQHHSNNNASKVYSGGVGVEYLFETRHFCSRYYKNFQSS